jgi:uncharacterized YigZ family protein
MTEPPTTASPDTYRAPSEPSEAETKVKGSRFIARVVPAKSEEEAAEALRALRKSEYTATHHCSAYRLGPSGEHVRFDDDGEPSGSAGPPILRRIEASGLTDVLVVVTRYYGGTKLGTGGLVRAYGEAAAEALDLAPAQTHTVRTPVHVRFDYADTSPAMHTIGQHDALIEETRYDEATEMRLAVKRSEAERFADAFTDALAGRGDVDVLPEADALSQP